MHEYTYNTPLTALSANCPSATSPLPLLFKYQLFSPLMTLILPSPLRVNGIQILNMQMPPARITASRPPGIQS